MALDIVVTMLEHSDHCVVDFNVIVKCTNHFVVGDDKTAKKMFNWYRGDYESINEYVSRVNWDSLICYNPCALSSWSTFIDVLWEAVDIFLSRVFLTKFAGIKTIPERFGNLSVRKRNFVINLSYSQET